MFKQLISEIKRIIKENISFIITFFVLLFLITFELPFYISKTGGLIDISSRIDNTINWSGSLNMAYVSSIKATIPTIVIASLNPKWDVVPIEEEIGNETEEEAEFRGKMALKESIQNAKLNAYKKADKEFTVKNTKNYVIYIYEEAKTNLKVGDEIIKIDNTSINSKKDINNYINKLNKNDEITILVLNNNKEYERKAKIIEVNGIKLIGILVVEDKTITFDNEEDISFKESESGPSGGLMMSLAIYSSLIGEDLTNGLKIAGTGTIDEDGNVGEIDGVKYKLAGAVKEKADIFIVPSDNNYHEALKEKENNQYDIEIIGVKTFDEVLEYLKN